MNNYVQGNPLNIRVSSTSIFVGERQHKPTENKGFKAFTEAKWGYRAGYIIINNYKKLHGIKTIKGAIARWCPIGDGDNDPNRYIGIIENTCHLKGDMRIADLSQGDWVALMMAMTVVEQGVHNIPSCITEDMRGFQELVFQKIEEK